MRKVIALPIIAAAAMGVSATASADAFKPSKAQQVQLGKQAAAEIRRKEKVLPSTDPRVRTLRRVASRLLSTFNEKNEPWEYSFDVIDNKQVNAFALPGGPVFFYTGILDKLKTEDELAGILGHELSHVRREHWAYAYGESQKRQIGLVALLSIFKVNRGAANILGLGSEVILGLPNSRSHETQADDMGFDMMVKAGYNPQGIVDVFTMLQQQSGGGRPPEFLSTHPDSGNRVKRLQAKIPSSRDYPAMRPLRFSRGDYWDGTNGIHSDGTLWLQLMR